jgi:simple sugar transport system ATP-binding protein
LQARTGLRPYLSRSAQDALAAKFIEALSIKTASAETPIGQLSGGNQQKALLARWLAIEPRVLILDEPTRGIDVGTKQEILERLSELARQGMSIVFISAEIEELLSISHRLLVLRDRKQVGELPGGSDEAAVFDLIAQHE